MALQAITIEGYLGPEWEFLAGLGPRVGFWERKKLGENEPRPFFNLRVQFNNLA